MSTYDPELVVGTLEAVPRLHGWFGSALGAARRKPLAAVGVAILLLLALLVSLGPTVTNYGALESDSEAILAPPDSRHWLGTDQYGRDVFTRLAVGGRISLTVGIGAVIISTLLGTALGLVSGYFSGVTDFLLQRLVDAEMSMPTLLLLLVFGGVVGQSTVGLIAIIGVLLAVRSSRVVRSAVLAVTHMPFVEAAGALGARRTRILLRHILPNVIAPILVMASVSIGQAIIIESTLSFLGYGVPPPNPSWGSMLGGSSRPFMYDAPWLPVIPGLALALTVYAFNMVGDGLRDIFDPKLRTR